MSSPAEVRALSIGGAARVALGSRAPARVFASFERSCYVETQDGIACVGGPDIGRGPLNVIVEGPLRIPEGFLLVDTSGTETWLPPLNAFKEIPRVTAPAITEPWRHHREAQAFLGWLENGAQTPAPRTANALIGMGPGLTPSGDDFVGGAMIALRAAGRVELADRVAAWALGLARHRTSRISRAHLACAAAGEGHEALHDLLGVIHREQQAIERAIAALARVGHSSGLDAAAGALLSLETVWRANPDETATSGIPARTRRIPRPLYTSFVRRFLA